jgi:hypothetical protein
MTPRLLALLLVVGALALASCGGGDDKSSSGSGSSTTDNARGYSGSGPVQSVQEYIDAFASGDYDKACSYIADESRKKIEAAGSCADVLGKAAKQVAGTDADMKGATASTGKVADSTGTVKVTTKNGIKIEIPVLIEGGRWKVNRGS